MSLFVEVVAWAAIATGALSAAQWLVTLAADRTRQPRGGAPAGTRTARSNTRHFVWQKLRLSLFTAAVGACLLTIRSKNEAAEWLAAAALTIVVVWGIGSRLNSYIRGKSADSAR
jgi:hypothetical protein